MKKFIAVLLIAAMTATAMIGCGSGNGGSGNASSGNNTDNTDAGVKGLISVVSREEGSGTRGAFIELFGVEEKGADGKKVDRTTTEATISNSTEVVLSNVAGDPNAIETLTLEDIDTYSKVSRRLVTEDVFSIVDTYIMPYSVECDRYSILGEIQELHEIVNEYTGENVYVMKLDVNGLVFDVCVPRQGLLGEPAVGRRFKANMWLQGYINY